MSFSIRILPIRGLTFGSRGSRFPKALREVRPLLTPMPIDAFRISLVREFKYESRHGKELDLVPGPGHGLDNHKLHDVGWHRG